MKKEFKCIYCNINVKVSSKDTDEDPSFCPFCCRDVEQDDYEEEEIE